MQLWFEELTKAGCDTQNALELCVDSEDFYYECVTGALNDPAFAGLGEALEAGDIHHAFECAHSLKGVLANTGLTPLVQIVVQLVEPLRAGSAEGLEPLYTQLLAERDRLRELVQKK